MLNVEATEAAKEKLARIKRPSRLDLDRSRPRRPAGADLQRPVQQSRAAAFRRPPPDAAGASNIIRLYEHQKRVIWRIIAAGSTYIAHAVGAGKTFSIAAAIMEQKRLGLISKAMLVVPGHCLAQASREFLQLYPTARILVADETNFVKEKRARFLARAATANWDAIIITHSAFRFIAVPAAFEQRLIEDQIACTRSCSLAPTTTTARRASASRR